MLQSLRTGLGFRMAMTIALFAALCFIAPPAVMAFGHGSSTLHCMTNADSKDHGGHMAAMVKDHGGKTTSPGKHDSGCCGLFCLSALPLASGPLVEDRFLPTAVSPAAETSLFGRVTERLDRPPISLLSV